VPPLGPGETAGASVPLTVNPALINPAANPNVIQVTSLLDHHSCQSILRPILLIVGHLCLIVIHSLGAPVSADCSYLCMHIPSAMSLDQH
jgi:hypothetical protein